MYREKALILITALLTASLSVSCSDDSAGTTDAVVVCDMTLRPDFHPNEVRLQGVSNVRCLDGIVMADGRRMKPGLLVRAGSLDGLTESDYTQLLDSLGVRHFIDLRSAHEQNNPNPILTSSPVGLSVPLAFVSLPLLSTASEASLKLRYPDMSREALLPAATDAHAAVLASALYEELLTSSYSQQSLRLFLKRLTAPVDGAMLWHCSIGRDRTGVASALLLLALGADKSTAIADFEWGARLATGHADAAVSSLSLSLCTQHFCSQLNAIEQCYGSIEAYLHHIGLTDTDIHALRTRFLDDSH